MDIQKVEISQWKCDGDKLWDTAGAVSSIAWKGVVKFYNDHPIISKLVIGTVALAGAVALTVLTGGAVLPLLIGVGASVAFGALVGGISTGSWKGALNGAVNGFMFGSIAALGGAAFSSEILGAAAGGGLGGFVDGGLSTGTWNGALSGTAMGVLSGLLAKGISGSVAKGISKIKLRSSLINEPVVARPNTPLTNNITVQNNNLTTPPVNRVGSTEYNPTVIIKEFRDDLLEEALSKSVDESIKRIENIAKRIKKNQILTTSMAYYHNSVLNLITY